MADEFKLRAVPKQRCAVCPPYRGENEGLRPQKAHARRRARHELRRNDRDLLAAAEEVQHDQ